MIRVIVSALGEVMEIEDEILDVEPYRSVKVSLVVPKTPQAFSTYKNSW